MAPLFRVAVALACLGLFNATYATTYNSHRAPSDSESSPYESSTEPPTSPARVGLNGYRRYYANNSFIGAPIACSYEDKVCFKYNLLFHAERDKCQPIGANPYICDVQPDRKQFHNGFGRLTGVCRKYQDPCPGFRMEYDQRCYLKETVRDVICGGSNLTRHFLGGVECLSEKQQPISVQQPPEEGRCLIPDLRFPDTQRIAFYENPLLNVQGFKVVHDCCIEVKGQEQPLQCTPEQAACFSSGSVSVAGYEGCFPLLERGPCPEDHVVAVDAEAALGGRAEAACVHARGGCARGHKRMAFDGQCYEERELAIAAPGWVISNQFGQFIVVPTSSGVGFVPAVRSEGMCVVSIKLFAAGMGGGVISGFPRPPCGANDKALCSLYELQDDPPAPEED